MAQKTIYCVQPYWHDGSRLARGTPEQFRTEAEARRVAARLYDNHAGVVVFSVSGEPEFEAWSEPRTVWSRGLVPA